MRILIVRLGALGDIVHTIPAAAALRAAMPDARIDWVVDAKHRELVDLVTAVDGVLALEGRTLGAWIAALRRLRAVGYDAALDFQGLMKSAVLARASAARRVAGFSIWHLREKTARPFYSETHDALSGHEHIVRKNLSLLRVLGVETTRVEFPLARAKSSAVTAVRASTGPGELALINPGGAWPNKRWPAERFGELAAFLREVRGMLPVVLWGPGEQEIARQVVSASSGAAIEAPPTGLSDILELARAASLIVSGDTGPLHLAAAVQTPVVALMGPTNPQRNGPWAPDDVTVSRFEACGCHYERRCRRENWCLADVSVAEMTAAVQQRLATRSAGDPRDGTRMHLGSQGSDIGNAPGGATRETDATEK